MTESGFYEEDEDPDKIRRVWKSSIKGRTRPPPQVIDIGAMNLATIVFRNNAIGSKTEEPCGVHWLLDLRWIAVAVLVLVGLVVVFTRLMR